MRATIRIFSMLLPLVSAASAANWPAWRGPFGTGVCEETCLPTHWSTTENVKWRVELPERGNSTPIVWEDRVFVTQPDGTRRTLMCFSRADGKLLWCRTDLGRQIHIWGNGASPAIYGNLCFLNFGPGETTYLIAVDKKTGRTVWKHDEETGYGKPATEDGKSRGNPTYIGSWTTPTLMKVDGEDELLMSWPRRIWQHPRSPQRIGSGVVHDGHIYVHNDPGTATCIHLKTGATAWTERLQGAGKAQNWSSVMLAEGRCYTITQGGDCFIFNASPRFELVSVNSIGEPSNSSIVASNGDLFIRTHKALWCIGAKK